MSLVLQNRSVGDIAVVVCTGRIVEGDETVALDTWVAKLLSFQPHIVLELGGVSFIDSAGLGLLIRLRTRARTANGDLKLCAVGDHIREVLRVTKLQTTLPAYQNEIEAITAFYTPSDAGNMPSSLDIDILCVQSSADVLAYMRELLKRAGYGVTTATNLFDAGILIRATAPTVLIIASELDSSRLTESMAPPVRLVRLPATFSTADAGGAAHRLLDEVSRAFAQAR